jgi:hypothetical protein
MPSRLEEQTRAVRCASSVDHSLSRWTRGVFIAQVLSRLLLVACGHEVQPLMPPSTALIGYSTGIFVCSNDVCA